MKEKHFIKNGAIALIIAMFCIPFAHPYDIDAKYCMVTHCNGSPSDDCVKAGQAAKECENRKSAQRKAQYEAKQQEDLRKHQAEINAAQKIEDANKALNPHN